MAKPALGRGLGALLGGANPTAKAAAPAVPATTPASSSPAQPPANPALAPAGLARTPAATVASPTATPAAPSTSPAPESGERVRRVALAKVTPCPFQPRKDFTQEALQELADSIREQGIIQPLIVRPQGDRFELIAGERRWRAAQLLDLKEIPVIVREADDRAVLELALIENLQRENLNPLEEAQGYAELVEKFKLRQEDVATKVGKSRVAVANALRLLKLDPEVQGHLRHGRLSVGHAKVLLGLGLPAQQKLATDRIIREGLSVRQTEDLVSRLQQEPGAHGISPAGASGIAGRNGHPAKAPIPDVHVANLQNRLCERLGTKVQLRYRQGKGAIEIRYFSDDELERILELIGVKAD